MLDKLCWREGSCYFHCFIKFFQLWLKVKYIGLDGCQLFSVTSLQYPLEEYNGHSLCYLLCVWYLKGHYSRHSCQSMCTNLSYLPFPYLLLKNTEVNEQIPVNVSNAYSFQKVFFLLILESLNSMYLDYSL